MQFCNECDYGIGTGTYYVKVLGRVVCLDCASQMEWMEWMEWIRHGQPIYIGGYEEQEPPEVRIAALEGT